MKLHTTRNYRDQLMADLINRKDHDDYRPCDLISDCNTLEDALADSQTAVKLLQGQVAQLKSEASTSVNRATHEHAVRYAEQMKAERDALLAETNTLAKDRYAEQCRADAAIARAENAESELADANSECADKQLIIERFMESEALVIARAEKLAGLLRDAPRLVVKHGGEVWLLIKDAAINLGCEGRGPIVKNKLFKAVEQSKAIDAALADRGEAGK